MLSRMRLQVDAILFDIDGTLVDSTAAVERTWRTWASRHSINADEILTVCHGRRSEDTIADFMPAAGRNAAVTELEQLELHDLTDVVALPAAQTLLTALAAGRWAAVTSGSAALMTARLRAAALPIPRVLVAAENVSVGKPDPEGYIAAAVRLGVDVTRCLVIEDAPAGILAGRAAGAHVVAVTTSHNPTDLLAADVVIEDLRRVAVTESTDGLIVDLVPVALSV
jgi:sugar-phosphatase